MRRPILCYVTDRNSLAAPAGPAREAALIERIHEAARAGVDWVQLREKDLEARPLFDLASAAIAAVRGSAAKLLINDRLDVAWAAGAAGVHLGENSLPIGDVVRAKRRSGPSRISWWALRAIRWRPRSMRRAKAPTTFSLGRCLRRRQKQPSARRRGSRDWPRSAGAFPFRCWRSAESTAENAGACLEAGAAGIAAIRLFQKASDLAAVLAANPLSRARTSLTQARSSSASSAEPASRRLPGRHMVADDLEHRRHGDRQNQARRSPHPSPKQKRNRDGDRVEMNAPPDDRRHQHVHGQHMKAGQHAGHAQKWPRRLPVRQARSQTEAARKAPRRDRESDSATPEATAATERIIEMDRPEESAARGDQNYGDERVARNIAAQHGADLIEGFPHGAPFAFGKKLESWTAKSCVWPPA